MMIIKLHNHSLLKKCILTGIVGLLGFFILTCNKRQHKIAAYVYYEVDEKEYDDVLYYTMKRIVSNIYFNYLNNTTILNDFQNEYHSFLDVFVDTKTLINGTKHLNKTCKQFSDDIFLTNAILQAKTRHARLLLIVKAVEINASNIYNIHFTVLDLEDSCKEYKVIPTIKINRKSIKERKELFDRENTIAQKEIFNKFTEIIKKTEK